MLGSIISLFGSGLAKELRRAFEARANAQTEQERIEAELRIAHLEARQASRALGGRLTAWVQAIWAAPFILYNAKLLIWDKVLGLGATDPLSQSLMDLQLRIVTFYFGGAVAIGAINAIRR